MATTCYRHSNRETAVGCSNCGNPICPDCMTSTSVGMRCPDCAGQRTKLIRPAFGSSFADGAAPVTTALIAINVAVALIGFLIDGSFEGSRLHIDGYLNGPAIDRGGEWWRIITSGFLHYGVLHLAFNTFALYMLGRLLESAIGAPRFAGIYFASLFCGSFGALFLDPHAATVGASGAVFGVFGASFVVLRDRGFDQVASQVGLLIGVNLVFSFTVGSISVGGHLGGLAGGALLGALITRLDRATAAKQGVRIAVGACAALAAAAFAACLVVA